MNGPLKVFKKPANKKKCFKTLKSIHFSHILRKNVNTFFCDMIINKINGKKKN